MFQTQDIAKLLQEASGIGQDQSQFQQQFNPMQQFGQMRFPMGLSNALRSGVIPQTMAVDMFGQQRF